jgi:hypothetical protein
MSEEKSPAAKPYESKSEAKASEAKAEARSGPKPPPDGVGESSDPAVHKLLADRQSLESNRALLDPEPNPDAVKAVDEQIAAVDEQLGELGYK